MQKRCCNCFCMYEDLDDMCPYCGYCEGEPGKEIYYLAPGTRLSGLSGAEYIIGEVVGVGGFGIIYKAWETKLERLVAIKEYFPTKMVTRGVGEQKVAVFSSKKEAEYAKGLHNFWQEATIMSLCADCDNVCNSYDKFEANGTAYMVMEFLEGKTLKKYVAERKGEPLEETEIMSYIIQILNGLEEIHKRGVIHLDIAPDNIYVMRDGRIKISDFGAAQAKKVEKDGDEIVLKPGFAPPEQYRQNARLGVEADIYAVGANLYWLLTGEVPLEATDREREDLLLEPAKMTIVSPALNNVTMRALAIRPELRYKNCQEFITELKKEKVRSLEEELKRRKNARRSFISAIVLSLLGILVGAVYFGVLKDKIWQDSILVWVAVEDEENVGAQERRRFEEVAELFRHTYPQVEVEIVVKNVKTIEAEFLQTQVDERPDLIETAGFSADTQMQLSEVDDVLERAKVALVPTLENWAGSGKNIPVGFYISVLYAECDKELAELEKLSDLEQFIAEKVGYCESDSSKYLLVQSGAAGRYQLLEAEDKLFYTAENFGIYQRSGNRKKAAKAFLEYLLTDAAQDVLHIRNQSGYMPVAENAWLEYIGVYGEFSFLQNSLDEYQIEEGR